VTADISYFSLASIAALIAFVAIMIPRALFHLARKLLGGSEPADRWLIAIAVSALACIGLGVVMAVWSDRAHRMLDASGAVTLTFLLFAAPAVLQVLRAWRSRHAKRVKLLSHALVLLAILSLPASMAIPTAALMQATALASAAAPAPPDHPSAAVVDERFFTDNEVANDPEDYPAAAFLEQNFTWRHTFAPHPRMRGVNFYREIPTFTAFWFDQTTNMLSFDATDTFGVLISRIAHVRANWAFSLAVFVYKLLCALVLVAVTFDNLLAPLLVRARRGRGR
jgi:hypothetical protein